MNWVNYQCSEFVHWAVNTPQQNIIFTCIIVATLTTIIVNILGNIMKNRYTRARRAKIKYTGRKWHRNRLFSQGNICGICEKPITNAKDATVDHIMPLSLGGRDDIENMQLAHKTCNELKGNNYEEIGEEW